MNRNRNPPTVVFCDSQGETIYSHNDSIPYTFNTDEPIPRVGERVHIEHRFWRVRDVTHDERVEDTYTCRIVYVELVRCR